MADQNKVRPIVENYGKKDVLARRRRCRTYIVRSIAYYVNPLIYVIFSFLYFYFYYTFF